VALHAILLLVLAAGLRADDSAAVQAALAELQRGNFAAAEVALRAELQSRPTDAAVLTLLGVALDRQKKFPEAGEMHRRAAASSPNSPDVWNNYANHQLSTGDEDGARQFYQRVLALDPSHPNANIQLARLALKQKNGADVLQYFAHLPAAQRDAPNLIPMRIAALYLVGQTADADKAAANWLASTRADLSASFSTGLALAGAEKFEQAEAFFSQALALAPSDFNVLVNLGVVAWHTGHLDRSREVLETALRQQPQNIDAMYNLACVNQTAGKPEAAVSLLALASKLAPERGDIQELLAVTTGDLGALADSAQAWDRYLKLQPNDDVARRERGFTAFQMGKFEQGMADLRAFVGRHPDDAVGHFELGVAENRDNPAEALKEFDKALLLKAEFAAARGARGGLYYQMGKPESAVTDLEAAAKLRPEDPVSLDRLGQTYLVLDRAADAARVLKKAASLAPGDSKLQLHLAHALAEAGQAEESKAAMDRFRQMGPAVTKAVPGGLVDYLSLTPERRRAEDRSRVERVVREHPDDAASQVTYLRLLLEESDVAKALETAHQIVVLKPPAAVLADAGRALLEARLYGPAQDLLQQASASVPGLEPALAQAAFHASGPVSGMQLLERVPAAVRSGDYYLLLAEIMGASGDAAGSLGAIQQALRVSPGQATLYKQACAFLLRAGRRDEALQIAAEAVKALPQNRDVLLLSAVLLEQAGRPADAVSLLEQVQNRWPEWHPAWTAAGFILGAHAPGNDANRQAALSALRTAIALGVTDPEVKRYLDDLEKGAEAKTPDLVGVLLSELVR
jgi:tetratricopeptide (TPR) repeat protein